MECRENDSSNLAQIVIRHTHAYLDVSHHHRDTFVKESLIPALVDAGAMSAEPDNAEDYQRWLKTKCKQVERILKGESPMPSDFVFGWIAALPEVAKRSCMHSLCSALGSFYLPLSTIGTRQSCAQTEARLSDISQEFSDVLANAAPAMDGHYDERDSREDLQRLSDEIFEMIAAGFAELGRIKASSGVVPTAYSTMANSPLFN